MSGGGPFEHPMLRALFKASPDLDHLLSFESELAQAIRFERALAVAEGACGVINPEHAAKIDESLESFSANTSDLESGMAQDGVYVPRLVEQMRLYVGGEAATYVHFGATSQDVVDTALVLRLRPILAHIENRLLGLLARLAHLDQAFGQNELSGVTRMQIALPITVSDRIEGWSAPLKTKRDALSALKQTVLQVQLGGAVGTLDRLGDKGADVRRHLATLLELGSPSRAWHTDRTSLLDLGHWLAALAIQCGKIGQDVGLMALMGGQIALSGSGTSSAMPHKQNPVHSEVLVSLARFAAAQNATLMQSGVHEMERSGSAWTLEWMVLPQLIQSAAASLTLTELMLSRVTRLGISG